MEPNVNQMISNINRWRKHNQTASGLPSRITLLENFSFLECKSPGFFEIAVPLQSSELSPFLQTNAILWLLMFSWPELASSLKRCFKAANFFITKNTHGQCTCVCKTKRESSHIELKALQHDHGYLSFLTVGHCLTPLTV